MSTRRARISAKPNLSRGSRSAAPPTSSSLAPPTSSHQVGDKETTNTDDSSKTDNSAESGAAIRKQTDNSEAPATATTRTTEGQVDSVQKSNAPVETSEAVKKPPTRRAKIQAKPSISRKPRQAAGSASSASNSSASTTSAHTDASSDTTSAHTTDSSDITPSQSAKDVPDSGKLLSQSQPDPSSTGVQVSPAGKDGACDAGTEAETVKISRQFKPKTKPNVLEAGKARMRRISESLDLPPHSPLAKRQRHASGTVGAGVVDPSESVVKVVPLKPSSANSVSFESEAGTALLFSQAAEAAKKRSEVKNSEAADAELDREIIEREHEELIARGELEPDPKPRRARKPVRRVIKSDQAPDTAKMTIKELLYYQPTSNPLPQIANEQKDGGDKTTPTLDTSTASERPPEGATDDSNDGEPAPAESNTDELAPQLMIGDDGQIIINEQSLTVQTEAPKQSINYEEVRLDRDEGATYSSFRAARNKRFWTPNETRQFYKALNAVGTDFSLMCELFPKRTRTELKNKFKKEEKTSLSKIELALAGKLDFEVEPFPDEPPKEVVKEKAPSKKKGGVKMRTYYEVEDDDGFRRAMLGKRLRGESNGSRGIGTSKTKKQKTGDTGPTNESTHEHNPPKLTLGTMGPPMTVPRPIQPTGLKPMPSISSMLNQNEKINQKITQLMVPGNSTPTRPTDNSAVTMSPLYNLESGETIMVQTLKVVGTDKKVHNLYLYTPPRPDGTGNSTTPLSNVHALEKLIPPEKLMAPDSFRNNQQVLPTSQQMPFNNQQVSPASQQVPSACQQQVPSHNQQVQSHNQQVPSTSQHLLVTEKLPSVDSVTHAKTVTSQQVVESPLRLARLTTPSPIKSSAVTDMHRTVTHPIGYKAPSEELDIVPHSVAVLPAGAQSNPNEKILSFADM